jgi:hypothetical protein
VHIQVSGAVNVAPGNAVFALNAKLDMIFTDFGGISFFDPFITVILVVTGLGSIVK